MKVLAIQLKRIGDVVLTTPALQVLADAGARVSLVVDGGCSSLLPAIGGLDEKLVHRKRSWNTALWRRLRANGWDAVLDFTGSDRSAVMTWCARAPRRVTFDSVRARWWKRLVYDEYVNSPVRQAHTCDHYGALARAVIPGSEKELAPALHLHDKPRIRSAELLAEAGIPVSYVLVHPGTARREKYWPATHWSDLIARLRSQGHAIAVTCGPDIFEQRHARDLMVRAHQLSPSGAPPLALITPPDLLTLAAIVEGSRLVISCDTSVVHIAAALLRPQISIFGPTNPYHWRPRHKAAVVLSAGCPDAPLTEFQPKMKGAPTENLTVGPVLSSAERLLREGPSVSVSGGTT